MSDPTLHEYTPEQKELLKQLEACCSPTPERRLKDWEELSEAFIQLGLPPEARTRKLWPNSWHQDCAAVASALHGWYNPDGT